MLFDNRIDPQTNVLNDCQLRHHCLGHHGGRHGRDGELGSCRCNLGEVDSSKCHGEIISTSVHIMGYRYNTVGGLRRTSVPENKRVQVTIRERGTWLIS